MQQIDYTKGWIEQVKDGEGFVTAISENTGEFYRDAWIRNAKKNAKMVKKCGWALEDYMDAYEGKTVILIGASPALEKNIHEVYQVRSLFNHDPDFFLMALSSNIRYVLDKGIRPDFCMVSEADPRPAEWIRDVDTDGMTLIANVCTAPEILAEWKGPIKFIAFDTEDRKVVKALKRLYPNANGNGRLFFGLFSQYNTACGLAHVMGAKVFIFIGNELSYAHEKEGRYYVDREDPKDNRDRKPHIDIQGNVVWSDYGLMALKLCLEDWTYRFKSEKWYFNSTEAGIFGVSRKHGQLPWILQIELHWAIRQAKAIMRTGKPITLEGGN